jgi:hypothetical protein
MKVLNACIVLAAGVAVGQESGDIGVDPLAELLIARQPELTAAFFKDMGPRVIQKLTESGLAPADSERVARQYAADIAECGTTMIVEEAARQSVPIMELFARFFAAMQAGDWNRPDVTERLSGVVDVNSTSTGLYPCITSAAQRAGLSYEEEGEATRQKVFPNEP